MSDIEREMVQFGGGVNAAGAIRAVADRTGDILGTAARIAEVLHSGLDLTERAERLLIRLSVGIQGNVVDVARHARTSLTRAVYRALGSAGLGAINQVSEATDEQLLPLVGNDEGKLTVLRDAAAAELRRRSIPKLDPVPLPEYEA
jgi:hypothetical protein